MRSIKFRAWDKKREKWADPATFGIRLEGLSLMQFTGLNDIEGKPIYEGDVVEKNIWINDKHKGWYKGEVIFSGCQFKFKHKCGHVEALAVGRSKIIGNRFDNPELVEE